MHKEMLDSNKVILNYIISEQNKKKNLNYSELSQAPSASKI